MMVQVERVLKLENIPQEKHKGTETAEESWPKEGGVGEGREDVVFVQVQEFGGEGVDVGVVLPEAPRAGFDWFAGFG